MVSKNDRETFPHPLLTEPQLSAGMTLSTKQPTLLIEHDCSPIKSSFSADYVTQYEFGGTNHRYTNPRYGQEEETSTVQAAVLGCSGVQTCRSDSDVTVHVGQRSNRGQRTSNLHHIGKELFFPVPGVDVDSFKSDMPLSPRQTLPSKTGVNSPLTQIHGKKVLVNGKEIALFYYNDEFYAVDEKCPHLGGPLHLGDIEDGTNQANNSPCVICPWHKWCFELATGRQMRPSGRHKHIQSYPVSTDKVSGQIYIGFSSFDSSCFNTNIDF